jgi:NADH-quinone oxidoreductase subunit G
VSYNQNGVFRMRPKLNKEVNGHWMCDEGREVYKHTNKEFRLEQVVERNDELGGVPVSGKPVALALQEISKNLKNVISKNSDGVAVILTAQYSVEELDSLLSALTKLKVKNFFYWKNNEESFDSFDGLLLRGDKSNGQIRSEGII